ncbi:MAG: hypothetical protein NZR01_16490 [Bryobacteraceae bacterium]|nr:hypothetical protein [Bryobacteraceae bacterium]
MAEPIAFVTAAAPNYLAQVRVLCVSLGRFHPESPFYAFLAGDEAAERAVRDLGVRVLPLRDLRLRGLAGMLLRYGPKEFCAAVKPALMLALLRMGHSCAVFIDPDMLALDSLADCLAEASAHALTVTPHLDPDCTDGREAAFERSLLLAGMFNGGFLAATNRTEATGFLEWWQERLRTACYEDVGRGIHFDQRWLDLAPGYVADLHILRDPGINAAYWRLPWVRRGSSSGRYLVRGLPLRLFHFSGYNPARPGEITRFRPGWLVESLPQAAELFRHYRQRLLEEGWNEHSCRPWPWGELWRLACGFRSVRRELRLLLPRLRRRWEARTGGPGLSAAPLAASGGDQQGLPLEGLRPEENGDQRQQRSQRDQDDPGQPEPRHDLRIRMQDMRVSHRTPPSAI